MAFASILFVALFVFWIWAIFDCVRTPKDECRNLPKLAWVLLIVLFGAIASFAWLFFGRPRADATRTGTGWQPHITNPRPPRRSSRPVAKAQEAARPEVTDRRSAELDRQLDEWERGQARSDHDDHNQG